MSSDAFKIWWSGFSATGDLGVVRFGQTRDQVRGSLGEPDHAPALSSISERRFTFDGLEFHFEDGANGGLILLYKEGANGVPLLSLPRCDETGPAAKALTARMRESYSPSVTCDVEPSTDEYRLQIGLPAFEVGVCVPRKDAALFERVYKARWNERGSIRIGSVAGAPAFWCADADSLSVFIGNDDESWDLALSMSLEVLKMILAELSDEGFRG